MVHQLLIAMPDLASSEVWLSLLTLTFLEIVLGIDNIIFITIAANRLPAKDQKKAAQIGLVLAMLLRIALLFGITALVALNDPIFEFHSKWLDFGFSGQSLILIGGGLFLLYKSVTEIHHKLEGDDLTQAETPRKNNTLTNVIVQITLINIVFSFDSILTAVGMTTGVQGALIIMIIAVVASVIIMMLFAVPVGKFVNEHPTFQILGLSFLILIGFTLIAEGAHLGHVQVADTEVGSIPKGYLYFAIAFSLGVEFLNLRLRKRRKPVELHGEYREAVKKGLIKENGKGHEAA